MYREAHTHAHTRARARPHELKKLQVAQSFCNFNYDGIKV